VDASLLLLGELGTVDWQDPKYVSTVNRIGKTLRKNGMLARYVEPDDFGVPKVAFSVCTFWYINALCAIGRRDEAIEIFEEMLRHRNHVGLMSEDLSSAGRGELWGNFPQTYSMVGIVNCAMRLSRPWDGAL
jgi:pentatricopeptide repeat protein